MSLCHLVNHDGDLVEYYAFCLLTIDGFFLILIGRFLGGGGCFCFVFFSHSTLYFPLAFVFSAGDY